MKLLVITLVDTKFFVFTFKQNLSIFFVIIDEAKKVIVPQQLVSKNVLINPVGHEAISILSSDKSCSSDTEILAYLLDSDVSSKLLFFLFFFLSIC